MNCGNKHVGGVGGQSRAADRLRIPFLLAMALVLAFVVTGSAAQTWDYLYSSNDDTWIDPGHSPKRVDAFFVRVKPGYWYTAWIYTDDPDDDFDLYVFDRRDAVVLGESPNYTIIADADDAVCRATSSSGRESCTFFAWYDRYVFIVVPFSGRGGYTVGID